MSDYFHAIKIDEEKCNGCTHCLRVCPTQALRIRHGKAQILSDKCIDCGECMRVCTQNAIFSETDKLDTIKNYKHKLLVYSSVFMGQFRNYKDYGKVLAHFKKLGFDEIIGVDMGALIVADVIRSFLVNKKNKKRPYIATNCPAVVRLIQVKYPSLLENVFSFRSMMDVAGEYLKNEYVKKNGVSESDIGLFYIAPCPAKVVAIHQPEAEKTHIFDAVFNMSDIYNEVRSLMEHEDECVECEEKKTSKYALRWSSIGDVESKFREFVTLRIDGIENVSKFLDRMENGEIKDVDFVDLYSCENGCVGGAFTKEDPFIAEYRIKRIADKLPDKVDSIPPVCTNDLCQLRVPLKPRPIKPLDSNIKKALEKMRAIEDINARLPQLDCGMCGSPTCYNFAEDIVLNKDVTIYDCPVILKEKLRNLSKELMEMTGHTNPIEED